MTLVVLALGLPFGPWRGELATQAEAQPREGTMKERLEQALRALATADACQTAKAALDLIIDVTSANLRVVPGREGGTDAADADKTTTEMERRVAEALGAFVRQGKCAEERGRAFDLKLRGGHSTRPE